MKSWAERTREEAHLLNPPFCSIVLTSACEGFYETNGQYLPFTLAFMVLPIVLHKNTRKSLPRTTRTSIPAWLQENPETRIGFHERLMALKPHTKEALCYGLSLNWLAIEASGCIRCAVAISRIDYAIRTLNGDAQECTIHARFLGKWFGKYALTETLMALWGICP